MTVVDVRGRDVLRPGPRMGTIGSVEDSEATQLLLETLFDMRIVLGEIHAAVVEPEDDDEETEEDA